MVNLVGLASQAEEQDGREVRVGGIPGEDTAEEVCRLAVLGHAAPRPMRDGDHSVHVGIARAASRG